MVDIRKLKQLNAISSGCWKVATRRWSRFGDFMLRRFNGLTTFMILANHRHYLIREEIITNTKTIFLYFPTRLTLDVSKVELHNIKMELLNIFGCLRTYFICPKHSWKCFACFVWGFSQIAKHLPYCNKLVSIILKRKLLSLFLVHLN